MFLSDTSSNLLISRDNLPQQIPLIVKLSSSKFVACWLYNNENIKAQVFTTNGKELSFNDNNFKIASLLVSKYPNFKQKNAAITNFNDDRFIIAFNSQRYNEVKNKGSIYVSIFNQYSKIIIQDLLISKSSNGNPDSYPALASLGPNNVIITWEENYNNHQSLLGKIINTEGNIVIDQFVIDNELDIFNSKSANIIATNQDFIVIWNSYLSNKNNIILKRFDFSGKPIAAKIAIAQSSNFHSILLNNNLLAILYEDIKKYDDSYKYASINYFDLALNNYTKTTPLLLPTENPTLINPYNVIKFDEQYLAIASHYNKAKGTTIHLFNYQQQQLEHYISIEDSIDYHLQLIKYDDKKLMVIGDFEWKKIIVNFIEITENLVVKPSKAQELKALAITTTNNASASLINQALKAFNDAYNVYDPYFVVGVLSGLIAYEFLPIMVLAPMYTLYKNNKYCATKVEDFIQQLKTMFNYITPTNSKYASYDYSFKDLFNYFCQSLENINVNFAAGMVVSMITLKIQNIIYTKIEVAGELFINYPKFFALSGFALIGVALHNNIQQVDAAEVETYFLNITPEDNFQLDFKGTSNEWN
jgi:hypothetical protein